MASVGRRVQEYKLAGAACAESVLAAVVARGAKELIVPPCAAERTGHSFPLNLVCWHERISARSEIAIRPHDRPNLYRRIARRARSGFVANMHKRHKKEMNSSVSFFAIRLFC